ncbi:MAG: hypothetical protein B7Z02_02640 [Rhodobacterales bacterium 32-67-9]|nr:MAG: hypothetical protein B7Z02_02640 [Rhodobacterales bacterium 32-67-9]
MSEPAAPAPSDNSLVLSYVAVRQALGYLGCFLPLALMIHAIHPGHRLEASVSDYYYTSMGGVLTGTLSAIGIFLVAYCGYERAPGEWLSDKWLARIAGAAALAVALLPISRKGYPLCIGEPRVCWIFGATAHADFLHYAAASVFFLCLALLSLVQFPRGERDSEGRLRWTGRTFIFLLSGTAILAMMVAIVPYFLTGAATKAALLANHYLFWCESIAIIAFATSWLTKGRALRTLMGTMGRIGGGA